MRGQASGVIAAVVLFHPPQAASPPSTHALRFSFGIVLSQSAAVGLKPVALPEGEDTLAGRHSA